MKHKRFLDTTDDRRAYHIVRCIDDDPYLEECWSFHPAKGYRNRSTGWKKQITRYEYRMYRTWKYNREKQWKG